MSYIIDQIGMDTPNAPGTAVSTEVIVGLEGYASYQMIALMSGATGGSLDIYVQTLIDGTWYDIIHYPQLAAGAAAIFYNTCHSRYSANGPTAVGTNLGPQLAVGSDLLGVTGGAFRLAAVAGAGTTLGTSIQLRFFAQYPGQV